MKLLLAAIAAERGHEGGRKFIEEMAESTDYAITLSRISALRDLLRGSNPQPWVFEQAHRAANDTRQVTSVEKTNWQRGTQFNVSDLAEMENLSYGLADAKNPDSVPVLVEMARRTGGQIGPVTALGTTGDPRGIPICLELLEKEVEAIHLRTTNERSPSESLLRALGELKATAAVPTLLNYLHSKYVIAALGEIGDESAIAPLQRIVMTGGRVSPDPYSWEGCFQERSFASRVALIKLHRDDPIPKWIALLQDRSLTKHQRCEVIRELSRNSDARVIPPLLILINSDPYGPVINNSLSVLSTLRYRAAVLGLIDCFGADFAGKSGGKGGYKPESFTRAIAEALQTFSCSLRKWRALARKRS